MLTQETVEKVRAYPDVVAVISDYVTLKKRGKNYIGLCPFHSEKSPSFTVSPDKQLWHCFGCQESGDHIAFIMKIDSVSFTEAIIHIAQKAGIPVEEVAQSSFDSAQDQQRRLMLGLLYEARLFFEQHATTALPYLSSRGLSEDTCLDFHLGFCPSSELLYQHLNSKGFSDEAILKSGLIVQNERGFFSKFRERIMFPIQDPKGRTVGFGGRATLVNQEPKYLNSEDSFFFSKRRLLFAYPEAKASIKNSGFALIMEGYMDVITAHQFGLTQAVGTLGTALSSEHVNLLKRVTSNIILAFDSDRAGQEAIQRSFEILRPFDMMISVLKLDEKDPADFLIKNGREAFETRIAEAVNVIEYKLQLTLKEAKEKRIEEIPKYLENIVSLIQIEKDPIIQNFYIKLTSKTLSIPVELIVAKLKNKQYNVQQHLQVPKVNQKHKLQKAQEWLIKAIASDLSLRSQICSALSPEEFSDPTLVEIAKVIFNSSAVNSVLLAHFSDGHLKQVLSRLLMEGDLPDPTSNVWKEYIGALHEDKTQREIASLKVQLKEAEQKGDEERVGMLLEKLSMALGTIVSSSQPHNQEG